MRWSLGGFGPCSFRLRSVQSHTHDLTFTATEVRKQFLSWDRGEPDREWACLTVLRDHAPGLAPRPVRRGVDGGRPFVVMERLPGHPLGSAPLSGVQTAELGRALRRLYAVPSTTVRAAGLVERIQGPSTQAQTVSEWLTESGNLSACLDADHVSGAIHAGLSWLARPDALPEPRLTTLGIADLNPANIMWDGTTCRLIDFEDGGLSDPAYELADHVEHIAGRLSGVVDGEALVAAVGLSPEEQERMRAYRPLWAAFWLVMLLPGNPGFHRNPRGTTEMQATHLLSLLR